MAINILNVRAMHLKMAKMVNLIYILNIILKRILPFSEFKWVLLELKGLKSKENRQKHYDQKQRNVGNLYIW